MQKIGFKITKISKGENPNIVYKGIGYIIGNDIITARKSDKCGAYVHMYKDAVSDCHAVPDKQDEFVGAHLEVNNYNTTDKDGNPVKKSSVNDYNIWYKLLAD